MLPGDVLLVASFVSYVGCFTKQYRVCKLFVIILINSQMELLEKKWIPQIGAMKIKIPMSLGKYFD